jgi:hypothetical protein
MEGDIQTMPIGTSGAILVLTVPVSFSLGSVLKTIHN